ncbi:hypothetical protein VNO80_01466 [Phaseolus coccineus]|uniref:LisH domain-containing protein n=1 Tax=Phaseolus coccineus TaxID=3886 RepID=A0AAN9RSU7_PHACN
MTCERGNLSRPLIAFIVDQYLSRNQFSQTRASFLNEASSLFANARPNQNLLSLEEMMYQYIRMKKQNIELVKEKVMLMEEKNRIQKLLQDMQNALDIFNAGSPLSNVAAMVTNSAVVPAVQNSNTTPPVASISTVFPVQNTMPLPPKPINNVNSSSPMISVSDKKRKDSPTVVDGSAVAKKRGRPPGKKKQVQGIIVYDFVKSTLNFHVVNCIFTLSSFVLINMSLPSPINKADFRSSSTTTQSLVGNLAVRASHISHDASPPDISPVATCKGEAIAPSYNVISTKRHISHDVSLPTDISTVATCNGEAIAPSYNVISTKRVMVEPQEQMVYKEDNHDISYLETSKRDTANKTIMQRLRRITLRRINLDATKGQESSLSQSKYLGEREFEEGREQMVSTQSMRNEKMSKNEQMAMMMSLQREMDEMKKRNKEEILALWRGN